MNLILATTYILYNTWTARKAAKKRPYCRRKGLSKVRTSLLLTAEKRTTTRRPQFNKAFVHTKQSSGQIEKNGWPVSSSFYSSSFLYLYSSRSIVHIAFTFFRLLYTINCTTLFLQINFPTWPRTFWNLFLRCLNCCCCAGEKIWTIATICRQAPNLQNDLTAMPKWQKQQPRRPGLRPHYAKLSASPKCNSTFPPNGLRIRICTTYLYVCIIWQ
jgi:hypothetical protein